MARHDHLPEHVQKLVALYERDLLDDEETMALFQCLIDEGHCWEMGKGYIEIAEWLISENLVTPKRIAETPSNG